MSWKDRALSRMALDAELEQCSPFDYPVYSWFIDDVDKALYKEKYRRGAWAK